MITVSLNGMESDGSSPFAYACQSTQSSPWERCTEQQCDHLLGEFISIGASMMSLSAMLGVTKLTRSLCWPNHRATSNNCIRFTRNRGIAHLLQAVNV